MMISKQNILKFSVLAAILVGITYTVSRYEQKPESEILSETEPVSGFASTPAETATHETPSAKAQDPVVFSQMKTLDEILASHNDNDPRADRDLKVLNTEAKEKLRKKYNSMPPERRNERGFIVFLLGRNLTSAEDFGFFKSVINEAPCLSLENCAKAFQPSFQPQQDEHVNSMGAVLAYPQLVVLQAMDKFLDKNKEKDNEFTKNALDILKTAQSSRVSEVRARAESLSRKESGR